MTAAAMAPVEPRLADLLSGFATVSPEHDRRISALAVDSRQVSAGSLFLAAIGTRDHGLRYVADAVRRGAVAVAWEPPEPTDIRDWRAAGVADVAVPDLAQHVGMIADRFFGAPSRDLAVVGVTGTDGKTSTSHYIAQALGKDAPCGLIGTLGAGLLGALEPGDHTTPDAVTVQGRLSHLRSAGARRVILEASSHGLAQGRLAGVRFTGAVLTGLGRDHLDFHLDEAAYRRAKRRLFETSDLGFAVLNLDDAFGRQLATDLHGRTRVIGFTLAGATGPAAAVEVMAGRDLVLEPGGLALTVTAPWGRTGLHAPLLGAFNARNLMAALGALVGLGLPLGDAAARLAASNSVPGRMEVVPGPSAAPRVVVDYAHTPEALAQALEAVRGHCRGQLWCVFGCGGDRDPGKRPLMGAHAERLADRVVLTDDNPRNEDPDAIVTAIRQGLRQPDAARVQRDRGDAIRGAVMEAAPGDVVLIAGKGHEVHQEVGGRRLPFSDRDEAARCLREVWG